MMYGCLLWSHPLDARRVGGSAGRNVAFKHVAFTYGPSTRSGATGDSWKELQSLARAIGNARVGIGGLRPQQRLDVKTEPKRKRKRKGNKPKAKANSHTPMKSMVRGNY